MKKKNTLLRQLMRLGVTDEMDFRLEQRIMLSNRFALVIGLITVAFMSYSITRPHFNPLPYAVMLMIPVGICTLNYAGFTQASRLITSLTPAIGFFLVNLFRKFEDPATVDVLHYATPRMLILGSMVLPFTVFNSFEKKYLFAAVSFIILLTFSYDLIHGWFGADYQSVGIVDKFYNVIYEDLIIMTVMILIACGFMFNLGNQYDKRNQQMLDGALAQTEQLQHKEEAMLKSLEELGGARKKDEERSWVSKGLAEMSSILQSGDSLEKILDKLLSSLIIYTDLNQGAFFIREEKDSGETVLALKACYAYNRKKYIEVEVDSGEGLLGQAYLDGTTNYLTEIPSSHFKITSGLGEATPKHLIIVPMKINNQVEGLMEFGSFAKIEPRHVELLEKMGENIASYVANNRVNTKTKTLLENAQTMSAEMRENEEEMRQNLEELQATQEALARKEQEYQDRIAELERRLLEEVG